MIRRPRPAEAALPVVLTAAVITSGCTAALPPTSRPSPVNRWENVTALLVDTRLDVHLLGGARVAGSLVQAEPDAVTLDVDGRPITLPRDRVFLIVQQMSSVRSRKEVARRAAAGALAGAVVGFALGAMTDSIFIDSTIGAIAGAAAGALRGASDASVRHPVVIYRALGRP